MLLKTLTKSRLFQCEHALDIDSSDDDVPLGTFSNSIVKKNKSQDPVTQIPENADEYNSEALECDM